MRTLYLASVISGWGHSKGHGLQTTKITDNIGQEKKISVKTDI